MRPSEYLGMMPDEMTSSPQNPEDSQPAWGSEPSWEVAPEEPRPKAPNPTPEQLAARQQLAGARAKQLFRKKRTRQLIQMGGVMAAYGFETPEQVEEIVRAVLTSKKGPARVLGLGVQPTDKWPG